ncbi:MAG: cadherin-like domain-containing protein, partial [Saprospiraceae bacterium]|nr:cadherin-like domain-containing protein [Saprospiraceae bacterium]
PLALPDAYTCTGNVGLNVPAANGVKANDFDDNTAGLTITAGTFATTQGGSIMLNADGSFMYTPPAGFTGTDTYIYTLNDGNGVGAPVPATDPGAITITVSNLLWFIDNSSIAATSDGRLSSPFKTLADFNASALPAINQVIFIKNTGTNYTGGIVLKNGQIVYGSGHTGGSNLADAGVLPFTLAPNSKTLPAINTTRPIITNSSGDGVTLAQNNSLRGFDVGACSDFGMENSGIGSVGNMVVSEVSINNTTGGGFDASHGSGAGTNVVFNAISSSGGTNGINLTNCAGIFTVNGGTISNPTGSGVLLSGGTVAFSSSGNITDNSGFAVEIDGHNSGNITFLGNITSSATGIRVQNCSSGTKTFSGSSKSLATTTNTAVALSNNGGATINFSSGGLVISTSTGAGFSATGGGTVNVTGAGNTISSSSATALNVVNTTIGTSNLNFQSISSGNNNAAPDPANGIVLNNTGSGRLIVSGGGNTLVGGDGSGGTIQSTTGDAISLTSTNSPSITNINIQNIGKSGIDGITVTDFALANSTINNVGTAATGQYEESNIAFNDGGVFANSTISGNISITQNVLTNARRHGIQIETGTGTINNATITNNTLTSSSNATVSLGSAILLLIQGNASSTAHLNTASISQNTITNFPSAEGIAVLGGSGNASNNTASTLGANGTPITISNNSISGQVAVGQHLGSNAIRVSMNSQAGVMNASILNNNPITNIEGQGISVFVGGAITGTTTISANTIVANQTLAAGTHGMAVQVDDGPAGLGTSAADYNFTITNNNVSNFEGNGIRAIARAALGKMDVTIQNNNVGTPILTNRNGIRVDAGSAAGDVTVCLTMSGNTSDGSGVNQGIGIRKQGTNATVNDFGIVGLAPSPTTSANAAAKVVADNPAGGGCDVLSGDNFVNCAVSP